MAARFLELANSGSTSAFADVPASYWAHGYIAQLTEKGIVNGNGQGLYLPTEAISRAETVRIVNGILDSVPARQMKLHWIALRRLEHLLTWIRPIGPIMRSWRPHTTTSIKNNDCAGAGLKWLAPHKERKESR